MATTRISGIMSGFDTDSIIQDLMNIENLKLDKLNREKTYMEWEQEAYGEVISKINDFKNTYFSSLNTSNNITSSSFFGKFGYSVTSNGNESSAVSVTANADITSKSHTIDSISQLATKDSFIGNTAGIRGITTEGFDFDTFMTDLGSENLKFTMSVGSNSKVIEVTQAELSGVSDLDGLVGLIDSKVVDKFGSDYSGLVSNDNGELSFDTAGSEVKIIKYGTNTSLDALGITSGSSSYQYASQSLNDLFGLTDSDLSGFSINGVAIDVSETDSVKDLISKVNASTANVTMAYDTLNDRFTLKSTKEGVANNITIDDGSSAETVFTKLFNVTGDMIDASGNVSGMTRNQGQNAKLSLDGVDIVQASNSFKIEGVLYNLSATSTDPIDINIETNTEDIVSGIKDMVTAYNELVDFVYGEITEERDYDYEPLTDDEKEAMSDDEIEMWEKQAKLGILRGATELDTMLTSIRNAIIAPVENVGISLSEIGISSKSYQDHGKLTIDEEKLTSALENNYEEVVKLFTNESEEKYLTGDSSVRYKENGIGSRMEDILNNYVRTSRDSNGNKGILIIKAGIENDTSYYTNDYYLKIQDMDEKIDDYLDYLSDKEDFYYSKFSAMEAALAELESQASSLSALG